MATPSNETPKFVARYIENFLDLVENVPNDLSRRISRLHELQLQYESTLETLETSLIRFSRPNHSNDLRQMKYLLTTQNCLAKMQELSDNKLAVMQDALDQLDGKSRELDHDLKLIEAITSDSTTSTSQTTQKGTRNNATTSSAGSSSTALTSNQRDKRDSSPEPTYCVCNQVSYGDMICCDNDACEIEWFHFQCVSLAAKPKGKWYCPNCRGDRSNQPKK